MWMLAFSSVGFSCEWIRVVKAHPWLAGLILALSLPADESRPIGFETASVNILRRVKLGSGLCFTGFHRTMTQKAEGMQPPLGFAAISTLGHHAVGACSHGSAAPKG